MICFAAYRKIGCHDYIILFCFHVGSKMNHIYHILYLIVCIMRYVKQTFVFFDQKSSSHVHVENYEKMNKMAVDVRSDVRTRKLTYTEILKGGELKGNK